MRHQTVIAVEDGVKCTFLLCVTFFFFFFAAWNLFS